MDAKQLHEVEQDAADAAERVATYHREMMASLTRAGFSRAEAMELIKAHIVAWSNEGEED